MRSGTPESPADGGVPDGSGRPAGPPLFFDSDFRLFSCIRVFPYLYLRVYPILTLVEI